MGGSAVILAVLGVDLKAGLDQIGHIILHIGGQVGQLVAEGQHVGELAQLHVAQIGRAFVGLQGDLILVMHIVVADGGHLQVDLPVGVLLVPQLRHALVELLMLGDEGPHRQRGGFGVGHAGQTEDHAQCEDSSNDFFHGYTLLLIFEKL